MIKPNEVHGTNYQFDKLNRVQISLFLVIFYLFHLSILVLLDNSLFLDFFLLRQLVKYITG